MLVGDRERDRAVTRLREHFVGGRLTLEDLSSRTESVLAARSSSDLRRALDGLPLLADVRSVARGALRGAMLVLATSAWFLFSFVLLLGFLLTALIHGATAAVFVGFLVVWLLPTFLLARLWHRPRRPSS
jgi:hypothetical protein